jgi:hypothetical protein
MTGRTFIAVSFALGAAVAAMLAYAAPRPAAAPILAPRPVAGVPVSSLEGCIAETVGLAGKTAKLRELRHVDDLLKRAGAGSLHLVLKSTMAPLDAEQKSDESVVSATERLRGVGIETCRVHLLYARGDWVCPLPHLDDPIFWHRLRERDECLKGWEDSLAVDDRAWLEIERGVWMLGTAYAAADKARP